MIQVPFAVIGGSTTFSISFPDALNDDSIEIISRNKTYDTPFGKSPPLTVFEILSESSKIRVVTCRMHGWLPDRNRGDSSKQIFWVFREMGVRKIIAEGGVGCINSEMKPGDIFIPDDYIDFSMRKDLSLSSDYLLIMRDPVCSVIKKAAILAISRKQTYPIFNQGVYAVTDGRHFESRSEIKALGMFGADAVGQSFAPEVYLAREISACYLGIYLVVNFAEGVVPEWDYEELKSLFYSEPEKIAGILIDTIKTLDTTTEDCRSCGKLRVKSLLKEGRPPS